MSLPTLSRRWAAAFLLASCLAGVASTAASAAPLPVVAELEGIREYRLANGVQVLLFPDEGSTTTTVNVVYRVGSVQEGYGEAGMAHLLEHMMFKGTPANPDIPTGFTQRGVRWNATTSQDRTNYFSSFNASDETLAYVLRLEADRMLNSRIAKDDLTREMPVVRNEFERGEGNAFQVLQQRVTAAAYEWHAYGRPVIGARSDIENVPIERLQAFYKRHYRPDQATVMVAGRIDPVATLALIQQTFEGLKNPLDAPPATLYTAEAPQDGERRVLVRRVGDRPIVMGMWHTPALTHPDAPALTLLGNLLSNQPSGQLYKRLVESKRAVAAAASAQSRGLAGQFVALAVAGSDNDANALAATLFDTVEGRDRAPFTATELARVKSQWTAGYEALLKKPEQVVMLLSESVPVGDWRATFALVQRVQAVTLDDVERVAAAYLKPANRTWGEYLPSLQPERVVVPPPPPVAEMLKGLSLNSTLAAPERFDATPANLEARTTRTTLASGIRLATLQKQNRGNTVTLKMEVRWGRLDAATAQRRGFGDVAALIFEGSATRDRQTLADELLKLRANARIESGPQGWQMQLTTERDQLLPALALVADALKNPALPEPALARIKAARLANLQAMRQRANVRLSDAWRPHLNNAFGLTPDDWWDPRYTASLDDLIGRSQQVTIDDVRAVHRDFWSARGATVGVVGGIPEGLAAAIEQQFGDWQKPVPAYERFVASYRPVPPARFDVEVKDQANAELAMFSHFALNQLEPDFMPMLLATRIFGGEALDSRLAIRIRQQEGLSYGVSAQISSGYFDDRSVLRIGGSFAPENRNRMVRAVTEELARAVRDGFTAEELQRARASLLENRRRNRAQDDSLASELLWHFEVGKRFSEMSENDARIEAVTLEQLNAAFRRHVDPARFVLGLAGSFDGKAQNAASAPKP